MGKSIVKFIAIMALVVAILYVGVFGVTVGDKVDIPGITDENGITQGLDLKGGTVIVFKAQAENPSDEDMDAVVSTIRKRLDFQNYTEATVTRQGTDKIRVELPDVQDAEAAVETLGATAQLLFTEDAEGQTVVMTGDQVKDAVVEYGNTSSSSMSNNSYYIALTLTEEGRQAFAAATARLVGQPIYIMMDGNVISAPTVQQAIDSDQCVITGDFEPEEAKSLAANIKSGKIPFSLEQVEVRTVSATLGEEALGNAVKAGIIGLILVMLFMLIMYRLMGLMADIALAAYVGIVLIILANFHINLTLPGIAGIILSVGMAVDANVVIFDRIKEELRLGKTVRSSVDAGFNRALSAVVDSNITTIISAVILWVLGTGTIKGFGITVFIGIVVSMFSAVFLTRFLLKQMIGMNLKQLWLYGINSKKNASDAKGGKA